jgi:hypothetical protein
MTPTTWPPRPPEALPWLLEALAPPLPPDPLTILPLEHPL